MSGESAGGSAAACLPPPPLVGSRGCGYSGAAEMADVRSEAAGVTAAQAAWRSTSATRKKARPPRARALAIGEMRASPRVEFGVVVVSGFGQGWTNKNSKLVS
ncbi:hypothetical protein E2562_027427 [Oryza meyeriana var. granulata]|uniref:Uncharacterized protein n=1 Tax=Oryza meyeriana var. granulata TaxID=110450 RepID=A0A6G1EQB6_9ORYZ|nr:hypothetical protein E2562_027427 [Oryza meyeriana var. granulata]